VCKKKNILAVDQAEFLSLCQLVETRGILKVQGRKEARLSKVSVFNSHALTPNKKKKLI
jgi:cell division control protein 6